MTTPSFTKRWRLQYNHWGKKREWRRSNHCTPDNLQQDLADKRMANPVDPVLSHHTSQEKQPAAVPELLNDQPHQSPKQSYSEGHKEGIEATCREDHRRRTGKLQSRKEHHRADFNLCILCEKYLQHQQDLCHVFIDFKKAFNRVWHAALWATMKKYISTNLIQVIKNLYNKAASAVLFNSCIGDWFRTTVGV